MPARGGLLSALVAVMLLLFGCGGSADETPAGSRSSAGSDPSPYVGPRDVVVAFYADAAELNCEGAAQSAIFRGGDGQARQFVSDCAGSDDLTWAQGVEIGQPTPASDRDLKDAREVWPDAADLVTIPVAEGTSPGSPSDAYVVEINGAWRLVFD